MSDDLVARLREPQVTISEAMRQRFQAAAEIERLRNWAGMTEDAFNRYKSKHATGLCPHCNPCRRASEITTWQETAARNSEAWASWQFRAERAEAERDALQQRCEGYQASRDWAINKLANALGIEPDTMRAVEYYADQAATRIDAARGKHG